MIRPAPAVGHGQRDPEIGHERLSPLAEQDVAGLDVAVHDAPLVRVVERVGDLLRDGDRVLHTHLLLAVQPIPERFSFHIRHHVEDHPVRLPGVEQREDVRMLQVGGRLDLGQEALGAHEGGQLGLQDLQRDLSFVLEVVGQVDRRHAALTEFTLNRVAALEGCVQAGDGIEHGQQDASKACRAARIEGPAINVRFRSRILSVVLSIEPGRSRHRRVAKAANRAIHLGFTVILP